MTLPVASNLTVAAGALLIEAAFGYPAWLFTSIRHPVVWIGALIGWLDRHLNRARVAAGTRKALGVLALLALLAAVLLASGAVQIALRAWHARLLGLAALMALSSTLLAQRSLWAHVRAVADALDARGLRAGRDAVSQIVGRNPETLDEAGVIRAAIESLAENFSDGVVAPAFWCALFGLPGIAAYKAINTADSMIGHRTPRHEAFGWASARLDDAVNLPASRLAALWLIVAACLHPGARGGAALRATWRDAPQHRSPNAGWPEAAMAGALGLRLAGPRTYGATRVEDAWMGSGRAETTVADLRRALSLYRLACALQVGVVLILAVIARS
ncbi:MAG TPA: adenosylcobinamide-phosphate synthase CbiB [Acetobacteraceae bacterium]|nr:adenosylcobinamide-phosphate synthase CbiB [Acetobacteraceae bacterium]